MPKGVEHALLPDAVNQIVGVIYPLMPKGVEHSQVVTSLVTAPASDLSFDAERR